MRDERMKTPRVSICLPNLNTRPFLEERMDTILAQTLTRWELIVSDNFSDDGAWEFLQTFAGDPRLTLAQAPRHGLYANWNACLQRATGDYIYIATSDDTMAPDCLEKLASALEAHPDCDIAHCNLRTFDEHGAPFDAQWEQSIFVRSAPDLFDRRHIRYAPFDGLLHLTRASVYWSITQLLIRRQLFDRIGTFPVNWGSAGDFHWNMRAGLLANTIHVPDTWGGWRVHTAQATRFSETSSRESRGRLQTMVEDVVRRWSSDLPAAVGRPLRTRWHRYLRDREWLREQLDHRTGRADLARILAAATLHARQPALDWLRWRRTGTGIWNVSDLDVIRGWMNEAGRSPWLALCS
jgi:glycosyltransferase involved in cell wall biosynthesis